MKEKMAETVIVLGISHYNFKDDATGELREGAHLHYVSDYNFQEADKMGMFPIKVPATSEIYKTLVNPLDGKKVVFPAWCELSHVNVPDSKGKAVPKLVKVKYISSIDLQKKA
jgi:hypothetical protein